MAKPGVIAGSVERGRAQELAPVDEKRRHECASMFMASITGKSEAMHATAEKDEVRYPVGPSHLALTISKHLRFASSSYTIRV